MNHQIEITIDKEGNVSYQVKGMRGKKCTDETKFLDDALGEVTARKFSREYYEKAKVGSKRQIRTSR